jgi:hypothetical protein
VCLRRSASTIGRIGCARSASSSATAARVKIVSIT